MTLTSNPTDLYVLTGASRGMGLAMARQLLRPGHTLLTLARHPNAALDRQTTGAMLEQWAVDLADGASVALRLRDWLQAQKSKAFRSATLINNAGVIPRIAPLSACASADDLDGLANALRVGLEAPMQLTAAFLGSTEGWGVPRKVLNISSGLGRRAMASQSGYCAAKAGLDHFTRCVALDEALKPQGAKVCAIAPGVIDTDMQVQLRGADPAGFPDATNFAALQSQGLLTSPEEAAARVLTWLDRPDFGADPVADVRQG